MIHFNNEKEIPNTFFGGSEQKRIVSESRTEICLGKKRQNLNAAFPRRGKEPVKQIT